VAPRAEDTDAQGRANALLRKMTPEEKVGQLTQLFYRFIPDTATPEDRIRKGEVGSYLFVTDAASVNHLQHVAVEASRTGIPLLVGFDVLHGYRTIFPVPLALASSWDPALVEQVETIAAREAYAAGVRWAFAPMVDVTRDPRWGRIVEGPGEDPFLGAAMARAHVRGLQGPRLGNADHVLACVKHFAGYGAAEGGRDYDSATISEEALRNVYLPPFRAAVEEGVGSVMSAYMDLNDVPASANELLLANVLRREWSFRGFVVSDFSAIKDLTTHGFARDEKDAVQRAFAAGVNMDMGSKAYLEQLPSLVRDGVLSTTALDDAVRPILVAKIILGLFEHPYVDESLARQVLDAPEHRRVARTAGAQSAVLLRNSPPLLPLAKDIASIAVIGPLADSARDILGPWSQGGDTNEAVSVLQGIRNKLPPSVRTEFAPGVFIAREFRSMFDDSAPDVPPTPAQAREQFDLALKVARKSDVVVLVLGELEKMSGELASRASLNLPGKQEELLEAVVGTGKPVVLVLVNGRPLNLSWASTHVPAILEAWYPGTQGGNAVADLLFGDANPAGKLPVTWPRSEGQIPIYYAHNLTHVPETAPGFTSRYSDLPSTPLYPFGFGLSYTTFAFSNLRLGQDHVEHGKSLLVSIDVQNTGSRAGDEVVQLYLHQRAGSASRPVRELKGFQKVNLQPMETRTIRFTVGGAERSFYSPQPKRWVEEAEEFDVWVGEDSTAATRATFRVTP
jgi:beta-glucosidase